MTTNQVLPDSSPAPDVRAPAALLLTGIGRSFPGVRALDDVNLDVRPGEVHALVGENGAGKSTLMAIASGALAPDEGTVSIGGGRLEEPSPDAARALGLGIVRQYPALLPELTVAENLAIGVGYDRVGGIGSAVAWSQAALDPWQMAIDASAKVSDLTVEQRFVVEIAKALALEPSVLILDEPTEHLSLEEVERLFARVRDLVKGGTAIVYISHRIPEVKQIADRITVLRDGRTRGTFPCQDVTEEQIIELVVGRALETVFPPKGSEAGSIGQHEQLVVRDVSGADFRDVSFTVRAGEIVGLAGVQGNGQSGIIRALAGLEKASGEVAVDGARVRLGSPAVLHDAGVVYVPADRHEEGLFLPLSVAANTVMSTLDSFSVAGLVQERRVRTVAAAEAAELGTKTPSVDTPVRSLSGGNQQKVVMARTLLSEPRVLLAEEPTQGVDAGARVDIYRIIRDVAASGAAVVLLSSDGVELEGLCDRVLIVSRGTVVKELEGAEVTEAAIARAALTSTTMRGREHTATREKGAWLSRLRSDHTPAGVLAAVFLAMALVVGVTNATYFSAFNLNNLLFMAAPLILVGAAQHTVVLTGGIDLSVGPLTGMLVVVASYQVTDTGNVGLGILLMVLLALVVGLTNGLLVARLGVDSVVATLAMFMALQGGFLTLRGVPDGLISTSVSDQLNLRVGFVPVVTIVALVVVVVLELALRRTRWGLEVRAVGSMRDNAEKLGIRVVRRQVGAYVLCALLAFLAALVVMAQIGIGDGRPGLSYTLSSITVVVLAGASVFGGRGSYLGVAAAALLVQQLLNASPFLGLSQAWSYWLPGLIILTAAVVYAALQRTRKA
ncbi:ATP-binding cassette domain-containing protein [Nocardioides sp. LHG3406-4]|uniref:ATP-binding cassette domain-containing protein n=1 Tax=Nocardioides sp. LHG3406-4 TaxID=2804575 RepID=UPI003CEC2F95